jgi:hypothetical protein
MRPTILAILPLFLLPAGCQSTSLRHHTERQARSLTELQYNQVLDNIAMFSENPNSLPFFSTAAQGQTSNNYQINPTTGLQFGSLALASAPFFTLNQVGTSLGGTVAESEQWNTNSVLNPDLLALMRCVYQKTVGTCACDPDTEKTLRAFFAGHDSFIEAMHPGWYGVGRRCDVPKCAKYVRHCGDTFVWVMPEGVDYLTRLTMAILDLATVQTPLVLSDPAGMGIDFAKYNQLVSMAKDLSQVLAQSLINQQPPPYPTTTTTPATNVMPGFIAIQTDLNCVLLALSGVIEKKTADQVTAKGYEHKFTYMHAIRDKDNKVTGFEPRTESIQLTDEMRSRVASLMNSTPASSSVLSFRQRKDISYPQPPLGPPVLLSR